MKVKDRNLSQVEYSLGVSEECMERFRRCGYPLLSMCYDTSLILKARHLITGFFLRCRYFTYFTQDWTGAQRDKPWWKVLVNDFTLIKQKFWLKFRASQSPPAFQIQASLTSAQRLSCSWWLDSCIRRWETEIPFESWSSCVLLLKSLSVHIIFNLSLKLM